MTTTTTYGTIPTSSAPSGGSSPIDYLSRAKALGRSVLATRRPWREMARAGAFGLPSSLGDAYLRIRFNLAYFAMNYAIAVLVVVFLALLFNPVSLIVFAAAMVAWLFLYFLRDVPLVVFGRTIGDKAVLVALSIVTLGLLLFTNATLNILVALLIGVAVVVVHAAARKTDDLSSDEEAAGAAGWYGEAGRPY